MKDDFTGIRGTFYRRRPRKQRIGRTSRWNSDAVGWQNIALPDGIEDFDWQPEPIENDGTGTVTNRSGYGRVVKIPNWDE